MRRMTVTAALWLALAGVAQAAEKPVIGPAPDWVRPATPPADTAKPDEAAVRVLLSDQQVRLEPARQTVYTNAAIRLQTPQGLAAGNISLPWRPDTDVLTVHKLLIRRGDQTIDVLASGQTFTVLRREQNLDSATLDGVLTANIQPEGLQVGDILEFAYSLTSSDPVLKGHVEELAATWNGLPIGRAHLRMEWPSSLPLRLRQTPTLPVLKPVKAGGTTAVELSLDNVAPLVAPKGAPVRYQIMRLVEATDFPSWAEPAALMAPLYEKAAVLPETGPLRTEFERIRDASSDPKVRAEAALALVQDRIRYVALVMGSGGYVPADAETTWSRRFGDCKAKTALLLALLHGLGIEAEPVAVSTVIGDGMDERLPMIALFNHVLVRATIAGRTYWLDGTRTGDNSLDRIEVPSFGWGLPLVARQAALVRILPPPLEMPSEANEIHIDARAGLTAPAPFKAETVMRGDAAVAVNLGFANLAGEARDNALKQIWRNQYNFVDITSVNASFDARTGEERLSMEGVAHMSWKDGWYETDGTGVGYKADFTRDPGPNRDAPFAVPYPYFNKTRETILLPPGFSAANQQLKSEVNETVAGIEYRRHAALADNVFTIEKTERSVAPEFAAKEAPAAQAELRRLADQTVYLRQPDSYRATTQEADAALKTTPTTADGFVDRGFLLMNQQRYDEAIKDFDQAIARDPKNTSALADRALSYIWKRDLKPAETDIAAAAAIEPRSAVLFRARGLLAQMKSEPAAAVASYTSALEIEPDSSFALGHRAEAYWAQGNDDAALKDAASSLRLEPTWIDLYLLRANAFRRQGKAEEALKEAAAVEAAVPDSNYAHVVAGNIYGTLEKNEEAMKAFDRAIAIKPEGYIYLNRGLRRPKADAAGRRSDFDAALKLDPQLGDAWAAKAQLQIDAGDVAGAIATYSAALEQKPDDPSLLSNRGVAYARSGDLARAGKDLAQARLKATDAASLNGVCWAKATTGVALDTALTDCDDALAKAPDASPILDSRGFVLLRLQRYDDAIAAYDKALARAPRLAPSLYGRGVAQARKGDKAKADADIAAALKIDADVRTEFEGYGVKL